MPAGLSFSYFIKNTLGHLNLPLTRHHFDINLHKIVRIQCTGTGAVFITPPFYTALLNGIVITNFLRPIHVQTMRNFFMILFHSILESELAECSSIQNVRRKQWQGLISYEQ